MVKPRVHIGMKMLVYSGKLTQKEIILYHTFGNKVAVVNGVFRSKNNLKKTHSHMVSFQTEWTCR